VVVSTDTTLPYQYSWPIAGANNGAHTWKAMAFDPMGNSSTTVAVPVTVNIDITPPAVTLTTPTAGTTYTTPQSVLVKATATDEVEVAKVWFLRNNVVVSTDTASPYEYSWPITGANNGAHTWKATAFDAMGNSSTTVAGAGDSQHRHHPARCRVNHPHGWDHLHLTAIGAGQEPRAPTRWE
jgi:hypothetical protein